jgi:putative ABC transport system permease protein
MLRTFDGLAVRQLRSRPLRSVLTGLGVVLGVGMVAGVLLLVGTIRSTFDELMSSAMGKTDLVVTANAGSLSDPVLKRVRNMEGVEDAGGMVGAIFNVLDSEGEVVKGLKGQVMVAAYDQTGYAPYDFKLREGRMQRVGREIIIDRTWAHNEGYAVGDLLPVATPSGRAQLRIVGLFEFASGLNFGGMALAGMPEMAGRTLMEQPTGWWQISVRLQDSDQVDAMAAKLRRELGKGMEVQTPTEAGEEFQAAVDQMSVVLYFFSGVALFVGGFLILNAFNMTVLQRTRELGMLRTLGASRRMVLRSVLGEALVVGLAGTLLGLLLGLGLAAGLVKLMRGMGVPVGDLVIGSGPLITATIVGMVATAFAAYWPARRAARVAPIQAVLGTKSVQTRLSRRRGLIGLALFLPGALLAGDLWMSNSGDASTGIKAMLLTITMLVGMAMIAPFVIVPMIRVLAWPLRRISPAGGRLAADALLSNPMRTAATAAALTIGLSVVVVNSSMSTSFKTTMSDQIQNNFARDFTIQASGYTLAQAGGPGVPNTLYDRVRAMPEVAVVSPVRAVAVKLPHINRTGLVVGVDPLSYGKVDRTPMTDVPRVKALQGLNQGGTILSHEYASAAGLERGDYIELSGDGGTHRSPVVGILGSMGGNGGEFDSIQVSLGTMRHIYNWTDDAQLAVMARSPAAREHLEERLQTVISREYPNLEMQSSKQFRDEMARQIDLQFNMFNAILAIAVIVSLLGVVNTLAMSVIERTREIGVMRALGASRWQVRKKTLNESLLLTGAGALAGLLLGTIIGYIWVSGMGEAMIGIQFSFPVAMAVTVALAAVVFGVLASILPARRAARLNVLEAISYE